MTQFTLLQVIERSAEITASRLGHLLAIDATTLTRTLRPLQRPVLERGSSDAGVEALLDFQELSSGPATPALLDDAGVGSNPGTTE